MKKDKMQWQDVATMWKEIAQALAARMDILAEEIEDIRIKLYEKTLRAEEVKKHKKH